MSHDKSLVVHYNRTSECTIYPSYSFCNNYCVYIGGDADVLMRRQPSRLPPDMRPPSSARILMYWCYSVTMQIHKRRNSTTDQREGGTQSQECGTSIRCSGHWVQKCVAYCRLLTQLLDATLPRDCLASERELLCGS